LITPLLISTTSIINIEPQPPEQWQEHPSPSHSRPHPPQPFLQVPVQLVQPLHPPEQVVLQVPVQLVQPPQPPWQVPVHPVQLVHPPWQVPVHPWHKPRQPLPHPELVPTLLYD